MYFSDNHIKNRSHLQAFCPSMAIRTTRESDNKNKARRESLREPRHGQSVFGNACGSSANRKKNVLAFAEVPQIKKRTLWRLRKFRGAFPKALWPLQRSIQAILQGLGASFFRSSSRCKDFWKGRSAVEGIRFAPIDRWEAIRSCDLYPKCRSDPATHFRPRWTGHRIANGFPPFQTAPTFAALKT